MNGSVRPLSKKVMPKAVAQPNETRATRLSPAELIERLKSRYLAADQVRRGVCLLNAGRYDEAAAAFSKARQMGSTDRSLPSYIAGGLVGQGRVDEAAQHWARRGEEAPSDSVSRIRHSLALWTA